MGWIISSLWTYASAVGYYWLAIMGVVFLMAGDVANSVAPSFKEWLNGKFPAAPRRRAEIALMVVVVFLAGFSAWRDEDDQRQHAEGRASAEHNRASVQRQRADDLAATINGKGGYLDQISRLNAAISGPQGYKATVSGLQQRLSEKGETVREPREVVRVIPSPPVKIELTGGNVQQELPSIDAETKAQLTTALKPLAQKLAGLLVYYANGEDTGPVSDVLDCLNDAKVAFAGALPTMVMRSEKGVMVGVPDPANPSATAKELLAAITSAGITVRYEKWSQPIGQHDFNIFVGRSR